MPEIGNSSEVSTQAYDFDREDEPGYKEGLIAAARESYSSFETV